MSLFFIKRPNFAWVLALFILLAGLMALPSLPVAQYPDVAPPQITITATYPGASAKVLVDSVTSVIEEELNGAKGMLLRIDQQLDRQRRNQRDIRTGHEPGHGTG